jgi:hypothetical protein
VFNFIKKKTTKEKIEMKKEDIIKLIETCQIASCCLLNHDVVLPQLDNIIDDLENKLVS